MPNDGESSAGETRVGILGAGALGSVFGGYLSEAGNSVLMYDIWDEHVQAINDRGLLIERIDRPDIRTFPDATSDPQDLSPVDILLVFVKCHQTEQAIQDAERMYNGNTLVASFQNGLKNLEILREYLPRDNVFGGPTKMGSSMEGPGHVLHSGQGETKIGGDDPDAAAFLTDSLSDAGIETHQVADPEPYIWDKQFVSVGIKPVAALTELLDGPISDYEEPAHALEKLVTEAVEVARAKGIEIISDDPVEAAHHTCQVNYETMSSMLEDVKKERPTEIDHINGAIVAYGEEEDVDTPYNRMATALVKGKELSYLNK